MRHLQVFLAPLILFCTACQEPFDTKPPVATSSGCSAGIALIQIYDGFIQRACGCDEDSGPMISAPDTLKCTVAAGSSVLFQVAQGTLKHQILATSEPYFTNSPLLQGSEKNKTPHHGGKRRDAGLS